MTMPAGWLQAVRRRRQAVNSAARGCCRGTPQPSGTEPCPPPPSSSPQRKCFQFCPAEGALPPTQPLRPHAGIADLSKMAVIGGSHGGFLAGHLMGQFPNMFKCVARAACCQMGASDLGSPAGGLGCKQGTGACVPAVRGWKAWRPPGASTVLQSSVTCTVPSNVCALATHSAALHATPCAGLA